MDLLICHGCRHFYNRVAFPELKMNDVCPSCSDEDNPEEGWQLKQWETDIYINVYLVDKVYGGREEGGWWYDVGYPVESICCDSPREAEEVLRRMQEKYEKKNEGRRPISSVLSEGEFRVHIETHFAEHWPEKRPHYE